MEGEKIKIGLVDADLLCDETRHPNQVCVVEICRIIIV